MSATEAHTASGDTSVGNVDLKLEVHLVPVSDVDRAKEFYERVGFRIDADDSPLPGLRIVQTPRRAPEPRSPSAPESPPRRPARPGRD